MGQTNTIKQEEFGCNPQMVLQNPVSLALKGMHGYRTTSNSAFFYGAHDFAVNHLTANAVGGNQNVINHNNYNGVLLSETGLQRLYEVIAQVGALHDSAVRFPPPKCHPETRKEVLQHLSKWVESDPFKKCWMQIILSETFGFHFGSPSDSMPSSTPVHWLHGPAGTGKSAIAQTLCDTNEKGHLIASFFFSRSSITRNNPNYLFLTIAYCLATCSKDSNLRAAIDSAVKRKPSIIEAAIDVQFRELVVEPLQSLSFWRRWRLPKVVIIDGLDECMTSDSQQLVLKTIWDGLVSKSSGGLRYNIPLRFIIASRPEPTIRGIFSRPEFCKISNRTLLDDNFATSRDITVYLHDGFLKIAECYSIPLPWPDHGIVEELTQRASGQFIYAATVLKYVGDEHSFPPERLNIVVQLPLSDGEAFAELDTLYRQILVSNPQRRVDYIIQTLGFIFLTSQISNVMLMELVFGLPKGSVSIVFRGLHSIANISPASDFVVLYHKSFADFLQDSRRSKDYYVNLNSYYKEFIHHCGNIRIGRYPLAQEIKQWYKILNDPDACLKQVLDSSPNKEILMRILEILFGVQRYSGSTIPNSLIVHLGGFPTTISLPIVLCELGLFLDINDQSVEIHDKYFTDFLKDQNRSGEFFIKVPQPFNGVTQWCSRVLRQSDPQDLSNFSIQEKYALHNCFSHIAHEQVTPDLLHELEDFNFWSYFDLLHRDIIAQRHDEADQWPFLLTWRTEVQSCFRFFQDHPSKTQDHLLNSLNHGFYVTEVAPTHIRISEQLEALLAFSESDIPLLQKLGIIHDSELAELVFMMRICNPDFRRKHECVFISFSQGHNTLARACIQVLGDGSPTLHRDIHVYTYSLEYCLVHVAQAPHTADLIIELGEILEFDRSNRWKEFSKTLVGSYTLERIISWLEDSPEELHSQIGMTISQCKGILVNYMKKGLSDFNYSKATHDEDC